MASHSLRKLSLAFKEVTSGAEPSARIKRVNQYSLRARLGKGAAAVVFLGINDETREGFAVKRYDLRKIARCQAQLGHLQRELSVLGKLSHPHILKFHEALISEQSEQVYLILEYCRGGSLDRTGRLPPAKALTVVKHIARALEYLHDSLALVHGDVKPGNIFVNNGKALLGDFGVGHNFTSALAIAGTPGFIAPEFSAEPPVPASQAPKEDVWALGITWYQLVFGELPDAALTTEWECQPGIKVPETLGRETLQRMLEPNPFHRMSISEVLNSPAVASASEVVDLPAHEAPEWKVGPIVEIPAERCDAKVMADRYLRRRRTMRERRPSLQFAGAPEEREFQTAATAPLSWSGLF
jgi:carbon catabolite-derepressing protein kinase